MRETKIGIKGAGIRSNTRRLPNRAPGARKRTRWIPNGETGILNEAQALEVGPEGKIRAYTSRLPAYTATSEPSARKAELGGAASGAAKGSP